MNWTQTALHTALQRVLRAPFDPVHEDVHAPAHREAWEALAHHAAHASQDVPEALARKVRFMMLWGQWRHQNDQPQWSHEAWAQAKVLGLSKVERRLALSLIDQWSNVYHALTTHFPGQWPAHQRARNDLWCALIGRDLGRALTTLHDTPMSTWIQSPQGMSPEPIRHVLDAACWRPFQDKTQPESSARLHVLRLPHDQDAQRALVEGLSAQPTQRVTLVEHVERAHPDTLRAMTDHMESHAAQRLFFLSADAPEALLDTQALDMDGFQRMSTLFVRLPGLAAQFEHAPQARSWWLDHLHRRHLGGPMSPEATEYVEQRLDAAHGPGYAWPGNERELARNLLRCAMTGEVAPPLRASTPTPDDDALARAIHGGEVTVKELTRTYCQMLYAAHGTYEAVSKRTGLDRRTVKKYLTEA